MKTPDIANEPSEESLDTIKESRTPLMNYLLHGQPTRYRLRKQYIWWLQFKVFSFNPKLAFELIAACENFKNFS